MSDRYQNADNERYRTIPLAAKKYPQLANQVIFTTGSVLDEKTMAFIEQSGRPFLAKPFTPQELIAVVEEALK